jgi:hypothetical protein
MHGSGLGEEPETDREKLFYRVDLLFIHQEQNHVVIALYQKIVVGDKHLLFAHDSSDGYAFREGYLLEAPTHHL